MSGSYDVCVVGAGPAGAALATRLAQLGHDVVVVERHVFPRPHVGESLSPAAWPVLDTLSVSERVAAAGFTRAQQARVRWRDDREERVDADGMTVDRAVFDAILLERARAAGAAVLTGAVARRPVRRDAGWDVALDGGVLRARFLADASGRRRLLGGRRTPSSPSTLALHAIWRDEPAADGAQTRIDALEDGWLWGARLPGGGFRAIAFVDPETFAAGGGDRERLYRRLLAASSLFAELGAGPASRVQACDATSYVAATPIDAQSVKVGEAAFAIDPLSSSGVQTAIQTSLAAAAAVHSLLAPDGDADAAIAFYTDHQRHSVKRHAETAAGVYGEHERHRDAPFWRRRAAGAPDPARSHAATASSPRDAAGAPDPARSHAATASPPATPRERPIRRGRTRPRHPPPRHAAGAPDPARSHAATASSPRHAAGASDQPRSPAAEPPSFADLLPRRVRLASAATLRETPCLVGDRIELRRALVHPVLDRPVAFLGGSELAPLLDGLRASASLADAVCGWERRLSPGRGQEIARWLSVRGLIEVVQ